MAPDEPSGSRPAPVVLRIKLRYDNVDAMVQRFAPNVGKSGLFLPTKSLQAVGAEVKFELRLADDKPVIVGLGRVKAARPPDPENPRAAFGMAVELMRVTRESRDVILKMLERRKVLGLAEVGIPLPNDIDAARRSEVETGVKDAAAAQVPAITVVRDSAPILAGPPADSVPVLTAPRRPTGPLAVAKVAAVAPLAPEPPRKKRAQVHEIIEKASGPIASVAVTVPGLDDDVDVAAVLARARALAGDGLDAELEALRDTAAAPLEISIEAASAELARQLGGMAVSRDRSANWASPPTTFTPPLATGTMPAVTAEATGTMPAVSEPALAAHEEASVPDEAPAVASAASVPAAVVDAPPAEPDELVTPVVAVAAVDPTPEQADAHEADDEAAAEAAMAALVTPAHEVSRDSAPFIDVEPDEDDDEPNPDEAVAIDQIAERIHPLAETDYEEVEHTQIAAMPGLAAAFDARLGVAEAAVPEELERSIDQQLADAEADDDLAIASEMAAIPQVVSSPVPLGSGDLELPSEEDLARLDAHDDAELAPDAHGTLASAPIDDEEPEADEPIEEIDDFEILAEADADDADLLASDGERDASGVHDAAPVDPAALEAALADPSIDAPLPDEDAADEFADEYQRFSAAAVRGVSQHDYADAARGASQYEEYAAAARGPSQHDEYATGGRGVSQYEQYAATPRGASYASEVYPPAAPADAEAFNPPTFDPALSAEHLGLDEPQALTPPTYDPVLAADPALRPSQIEFVSRLELSDQFEAVPEAEPDLAPPAESWRAELAPDLEAALGDLETPEDDDELDGLDADSQFTQASALPPVAPIDFDDERHVDQMTPFPPTRPPGSARDDFDASDVVQVATTRAGSHGKPKRPSAPMPATDGLDLESALEALDVDLDDLAIPHAPTELPGPHNTPPRSGPARQTGGSRTVPAHQSGSSRVIEPQGGARSGRTRMPRVLSEIPIDVDDDE